MTKEELIHKLEQLGIHESRYSLYEGLKIDAIILEDFGNGLYRSFYYDEKGNDYNIDVHISESDAYISVLEKIIHSQL